MICTDTKSCAATGTGGEQAEGNGILPPGAAATSAATSAAPLSAGPESLQLAAGKEE